MRIVSRFILVGAAAVVAFDVAASLLLLGGSLTWMFLGEGLIAVLFVLAAMIATGAIAGTAGALVARLVGRRSAAAELRQ